VPIETAADRMAALKWAGQLVTLDRVATPAPGETVPLGGPPLVNAWTAWAVFDRQFVAVLGVESYRPTLTLRETDAYLAGYNGQAAYLAERATVAATETLAGTFTVLGIERDGTGLALMILEASA
jgi:hypothetical protein